MAKVLVAAKDLQPGKRITEADLSWKDWPVDEVAPVFITDGATPVSARPAADSAAQKAAVAVERVAKAATEIAGTGAKSDYIGAVVREPILAGEPILARKIVRAGDSGYMAAYLEPGMRAMAIAVTVESAAGGFILLALAILGGDSLRDFSIALLIGLVVGTYSSIFTATPLLTYMHEKWPMSRVKRERVERAPEDSGAVV